MAKKAFYLRGRWIITDDVLSWREVGEDEIKSQWERQEEERWEEASFFQRLRGGYYKPLPTGIRVVELLLRRAGKAGKTEVVWVLCPLAEFEGAYSDARKS